MLTNDKRRTTRKLSLALIRAKMLRAAQTQIHERKKSAATEPSYEEEGAAYHQAMKGLFSLVGLMRAMTPDGTGTVFLPKLILTASGMQLRFSGKESSEADSPDRLTKIEDEVQMLRTRLENTEMLLGESAKLRECLSYSIRELEERQSAQAAMVDSLRAAVQQNEETMEMLVDSINLTDATLAS